MSKELTEKWLNGDLSDEGLYYWRISDGQELIKNKLEMLAYRLCSDAEKIECLAPVPSYDHFSQLVKKIEKLQDQNADLRKKVHILNEANEKKYNELCAEIEKNKKLKEQLQEANQIISSLQDARSTIVNEYIKKWGLK